MTARVDYQEIIDRRRALVVAPYKSLADVGFDGPWVTPYQIISRSAEGPVLIALHWLDEPSILKDHERAADLRIFTRHSIQHRDRRGPRAPEFEQAGHIRHPNLPSYSFDTLRADFAGGGQALVR